MQYGMDVMVQMMREELTGVGFREMRTPEEVDAMLKNEKKTVLLVVNSVCGCAAGKARPAVAKALESDAAGNSRPFSRGKTAKPLSALALTSPNTRRRRLPSR